MPKSKKLTAVYALIMDLPLSIVVTMVALALGGNLTMERFIPSFCLAYVLTFFINFLPVGMIGFKFASKYAEDNTFKFGLLANVVIAFFFVVILDLVMTAFGCCWLYTMLYSNTNYSDDMVSRSRQGFKSDLS